MELSGSKERIEKPDYASAFGYSAIALFAFASYFLVLGPYINFTDRVLPRGDPFTYTSGWFLLIDTARQNYGRTLLLLCASAALIAGNWFVYIWSVETDHVLEASLGYFINPLVNVALEIGRAHV